jgi:hypothetical protein
VAASGSRVEWSAEEPTVCSTWVTGLLVVRVSGWWQRGRV